ncbi:MULTISPECIES: bifunctional GNAT family N-acetyltransferase/acetate--CoA ligase family protein [unclassified Pseudofrankia]|uniref:bifunctional acetate--CoA ligase family protein/GNAT family N-acetyltransferase n=1 Tax=unclassified Pseudofrankia TaxID=2994372 RepID=UPI0008D8FDF8|nr:MULTISPECIES: bifunctional GNAT family N-acetyltransferase/acetate--CoA ligase family protein [unclassified Pseudofrankia]MDT3443066.1 GNAT family N-acetyltransferase [Pseudofrankia sp. BMG5.37]OHV49937.1 acetyltransferase [Pseudofrankia sp. BMG5.36]
MTEQAVLPPGYPAGWEADVILADGGTAHIRPILPSDGPRLLAFWERLSERSIYLRFFGVRRGLTQADVDRFTIVDQSVRGALVALIGTDLVALAHWEGLPADEAAAAPPAVAAETRRDTPIIRPAPAAEVAFLVEDAQQGRGLGSVLLEHLAAAAWERGIRRFDAEVLAENQTMTRVFLDAGYKVSRTWESGAVRLSFDIAPTERSVDVMRAREHRAESASIGRLLRPRAVAVIGASRRHDATGNAVLRNLLRAGFDGPVYPVNPVAAAASGAVSSVRAFASVEDVDGPVDLAVLCVPPAEVSEAVAACGRHGVRGLVVITDLRDEPAEATLAGAARAAGMRVVGPASLGVQSPAVGLNASLTTQMPPPGRIGCYSQSGPLGAAMLGAAETRGLGLSVFVSAGDRADVSGNDMLQYWEDDPATDVALLHLETFGNPRKFARLARRAGRSLPVVVVRAGRSELEAALLRQAGVIAVDRVSAGFDVAQLLASQPLPRGDRVTVVGDSRALVRLTVEAAEAVGLSVESVLLKLGSSPELHAEAMLSAAERSDALMVTVAPLPPLPIAPLAAAVAAAAARLDIPVLASVLGGARVPELGPVPAYPSPEGTVAALRRVVAYAEWRSRPLGAVPVLSVRVDAARALVAGRVGRLDDAQGAALLGCYGVSVEPVIRAENEDAAVSAAHRLGWPAVLKARSRPYRHRPELGGQRLALPDETAMRAAWASLRAQVGPDVPLVVQRMAPAGVAVVLGSEEHPRYGPLVSFGLAGPAMDLLGDRAHHILPLTDVDADRLLGSVRGAPLLSGYRGSRPVDVAALRETILRVARLADDLPDVARLVLDPVIVSAEGVAVLSAEVVTGPPSRRADAGPRRYWTAPMPSVGADR